MLRNNDRCIALISGLLTLARGEQGLHRREAVDLSAITRQVVSEVATNDQLDGTRLRLHAPGDVTVAGDPLLLSQLVGNLVDNVMRYNVPGSEVLIAVHPDGRLMIGNTGPIIAEDEVEVLFEPFRRGRAARTGGKAGAELGLSIVRAIAHAHDGPVTAAAEGRRSRRRGHHPALWRRRRAGRLTAGRCGSTSWSVVAWGFAGPAFEGSAEGGDFGVAQSVRGLVDGEAGVGEQFDGDGLAAFGGECPKRRRLACEPAVHRARVEMQFLGHGLHRGHARWVAQ